MKKSALPLSASLPVIVVLFAVGLLTLSVIAYQQLATLQQQPRGQEQARQGYTKENCLMDGCLMAEDADYPVAALDERTVGHLKAALADERKALATYQATMVKFGSVKPFVNIARAEEQHITMLLALFDKYGVSIPKDTTKVGALPATLTEVCQVGVTAEIDNDALYQRMLPEIAQEDIKSVFTSLARASKEKHLPAFQRCAN